MSVDFLIASSSRVSAILLVALVAAAVLRRRSAALRHWILAAALACGAAAPLFERVLPAWQLPMVGRALSITAVRMNEPLTDVARTADALVADGANARQAPASGRIRASSFIVAIWMAGAAAGLLTLLAGLGRLARISAGSQPLIGAAWSRAAEGACGEYGVRRRVRLLQSNRRMPPATWGYLRPRIVLPPDASGWSGDRVRIVLLHELAHVARSDWPVLLFAEIVRAIYWFNPLVWIACRRLRQESERATDDAVLNRGVDGSAYAWELVRQARACHPRSRFWLPAPAMARPSTLERRVNAMLNARVNRQPISRLARIAIAGSLIAVAAAIAPAQEVFSSLSGRVYDSTDSLLPNVRMVLTSAQSGAKYEIRSDANGRFEFVGLPPGRYTLETELLGFANLRGSLDIGGERVQRDVRLRVGSLRETVTVRLPQPGESASRPAGSQARVGSSYATACGAAAAGGIGGNIRPPSKIGHTAPEYPSRLAAARQPGTVVLDARIGEDGLIREVNTVSATDPEFARAATDAIRQWAFSQTLLNCVPVEVAMRVTVNFLAE